MTYSRSAELVKIRSEVCEPCFLRWRKCRFKIPTKEFCVSRFMHSSIYQDHVELVVILQNSDVLQRISINQYQICEIARLDLAQLVFSHEKLRNTCGSSDDRLHWCELEQLHEMLQITGIGAVGCPCKSVITPW